MVDWVWMARLWEERNKNYVTLLSPTPPCRRNLPLRGKVERNVYKYINPLLFVDHIVHRFISNENKIYIKTSMSLGDSFGLINRPIDWLIAWLIDWLIDWYNNLWKWKTKDNSVVTYILVCSGQSRKCKVARTWNIEIPSYNVVKAYLNFITF